MSTDYDGIPTIRDRVIGSDLVALGRVRGPARVTPVDDTDTSRVHGWFEVDIAELLAGEPGGTTVLRVIGDRSGTDATWPVPVPHDGPLLLMLTRDIGPGLPENLYAPCQYGIYPVHDDSVTIPISAVDDLTRRSVTANQADQTLRELPIGGLREVLATVQKHAQTARRHLDQEEPADIRQLTRPDLVEYPRSGTEELDAASLTGGGRPAQIDP